MHRAPFRNGAQLTLKHFILKQQVIDFYRNAIRATRGLGDPVTRRETTAWIRSEIERSKGLNDPAVIEERLRICRRETRQILPTLRD